MSWDTYGEEVSLDKIEEIKNEKRKVTINSHWEDTGYDNCDLCGEELGFAQCVKLTNGERYNLCCSCLNRIIVN